MIAASGTLAQINAALACADRAADQLQRSVGDMYAGALLPALALAGSYALYVFGTPHPPRMAPALPPEARSDEKPDSFH